MASVAMASVAMASVVMASVAMASVAMAAVAQVLDFIHRHSDILMEVPFTQEKGPCRYENEIQDLQRETEFCEVDWFLVFLVL